ncbi:MAG: DUF3592 domain-containing protein [Proteobacteria bacterium]|nr:DUF3592 domain-containing protein [Pseudomonadota bacterium]
MKIISIAKYLFTVIGLSMLIGSFFSYKSTQEFLKDSLNTQGTVVAFESSESNDSVSYYPVVNFETHTGTLVEFTSSMGSNPPSYSEGEVVEILYQETHPNNAKIKGYFSLWGAATILGGMGTIFFFIGFSIFAIGKLKGRKIKYLKDNGEKINTKLQNVEINSSFEVNGKNPFQITTQWLNPSSSELHVFKSENIWFDPTDYIEKDEIVVLIEKNNPKKYYVDISFLPELAS